MYLFRNYLAASSEPVSSVHILLKQEANNLNKIKIQIHPYHFHPLKYL